MIEQLPSNDFRSLVQTLRGQWRMVAGTVLLLTGLVVILDLFVATPQYRSDTEVLVRNSATELVAGQAQPDAIRSMSNEEGLALSRSVTDPVEAIYGDKIKISVEVEENRDVLIIAVVNSSPELAQEIAAFYTETYLEVRAKATLDDLLQAGDVIGQRLQDLDERIEVLGTPDPNTSERRDLDLLLTQRVLLGERLDKLSLNSDLTSSGTSRIISSANLPDEPVSPNTVRDAILAVSVGLILGFGLAYVRALFGDNDRERLELDQVLDKIPVFTEVPRLDEDPGLSVLYRPTATYSEAVRALRTTIKFMIPKNQSVQIASAMPNDGKTTVTANLGYALAASGDRVIMIDADIRNHGLSDMLGFNSTEPGLANILEQGGPPFDLQFWRDPESGVWFIPSGSSPVGAAELLGGPTFGQLTQFLQQEFDVVLIDSPPLVPVTDGVLIAESIKQVLLTIGVSTSSADVERALRALSNVNTVPLGTVMNGRSNNEASYGYGYGYGAELQSKQPTLPPAAATRQRFVEAGLATGPTLASAAKTKGDTRAQLTPASTETQTNSRSQTKKDESGSKAQTRKRRPQANGHKSTEKPTTSHRGNSPAAKKQSTQRKSKKPGSGPQRSR